MRYPLDKRLDTENTRVNYFSIAMGNVYDAKTNREATITPYGAHL